MLGRSRKINHITWYLFLLFLSGCSVSLNTTTLDFGSTEITKSFIITVQGLVQWSISCNESWIKINPDHGKTTQTINVTVDRTGLSPGQYESLLNISTNLKRPCPDISVNMRVEYSGVEGVTP